MTVKALEVLLNGKRLYTVGMEDWRMLGANVTGHRQTSEDVEHMLAESDQPIPGLDPDGYDFIHLTAYVGVSDPDRPGGSSGQNYENHNLALGDEVIIRVVETDQPDKPLSPHPGGPAVFALRSESDTSG